MKYSGSVDIMLELQKGADGYDAVWPANSLWISLGDTARKVKLTQSIMTSPVVFGIRKSVAGRLGFIGKDVRVRDILAAIEQKKLTFAMTSASQSNSGASAYLGFLYALLGNPDVMTLEDLSRPDPQDGDTISPLRHQSLLGQLRVVEGPVPCIQLRCDGELRVHHHRDQPGACLGGQRAIVRGLPGGRHRDGRLPAGVHQ